MIFLEKNKMLRTSYEKIKVTKIDHLKIDKKIEINQIIL